MRLNRTRGTPADGPTRRVFLSAAGAASGATAQARSRPNFVIILADDLGWSQMGCYGDTFFRTPNLDRLAANGIRFTDAYSPSPVCSASRAAILTGRSPARLGFEWISMPPGAPRVPENTRLLQPPHRAELRREEVTIGDALRAAGYRTGYVGKWHLTQFNDHYLGHGTVNGPLQRGFDFAAEDFGSHPMTYRDRQFSACAADDYPPDATTDQAIRFLRESRNQPFLLFFASYYPHDPVHTRCRWLYERYAGHPAASETYKDRAMFGAFVDTLDHSVGRIVDEVDRLGLGANTLILFTSDNGPIPEYQRRELLRGCKWTLYEGGIRVPFIARWPGTITAGRLSAVPISGVDVLPTLREAAGVESESPAELDGRSILPLLQGEERLATPREALYWHCPYYHSKVALSRPQSAIRRGDWKMVLHWEDMDAELFHLGKDPGERVDLAPERPEVVRQMRDSLLAYLQAAGARLPQLNPDYRPEPLPAGSGSPIETVVYRSGEDGYHTYRIPALAVTGKGTLLAFVEGRKTSFRDQGDVDLLLKRSDDRGRTWSRHMLVYEEGGAAEVAIGNPCVVVDRETEAIFLAFCRDNNDVLITWSRDDGLTWSKPADLTSHLKRKDWRWYATGPGAGVQLTQGPHKGRLVIPCNHRDNAARRIRRSHMIYSDDHGASWLLGAPVADHTNECQVAETSSGTLMANMRNFWEADGAEPSKGGKRAVATSQDGGETWTDLRFDETLIEPLCQASLLRYDRGGQSLLLFSNPATQGDARVRLTIRASEDDGRTWPFARLVCEGPSAYSCLGVLPTGEIGLLYERGEKVAREQIAFARMTLEWALQRRGVRH